MVRRERPQLYAGRSLPKRILVSMLPLDKGKVEAEIPDEKTLIVTSHMPLHRKIDGCWIFVRNEYRRILRAERQPENRKKLHLHERFSNPIQPGLVYLVKPSYILDKEVVRPPQQARQEQPRVQVEPRLQSFRWQPKRKYPDESYDHAHQSDVAVVGMPRHSGEAAKAPPEAFRWNTEFGHVTPTCHAKEGEEAANAEDAERATPLWPPGDRSVEKRRRISLPSRINFHA